MRTHDRLEHLLLIVAQATKLGGELIQQFWIAGRVRGSHVIHWIDQPLTKQLSPKSIDCNLGKIRIVGRSHPVDQRRTRIGVLRHGLGIGQQWLGFQDGFGERMLDLFALARDEHHLFTARDRW